MFRKLFKDISNIFTNKSVVRIHKNDKLIAKIYDEKIIQKLIKTKNQDYKISLSKELQFINLFTSEPDMTEYKNDKLIAKYYDKKTAQRIMGETMKNQDYKINLSNGSIFVANPNDTVLKHNTKLNKFFDDNISSYK